jgi:hypothetical protein
LIREISFKVFPLTIFHALLQPEFAFIPKSKDNDFHRYVANQEMNAEKIYNGCIVCTS